jgi:hypothetical protein
MLTSKDVAIVYETLLTSPGMNDAVKISLSIQRKNVLLLTKLLEVGLAAKDETGQVSLLATINNESTEDLKAVSVDLLKKAGLTDLYERLNSLPTK